MLERAGRLGDEHERRVLERYRAAVRRRRRRDRAARRARRRRGRRRRRRHARGLRSRGPRRLPGDVRRRGLHRLRRLHRAPARRPLPRAGHASSPAARGSPRCCSSPPTPSSSSASACRAPTPSSCCSATARRACTASTTSRPSTALRRARCAQIIDERARRRRPGRMGRPALRTSTGAARRASSRCRRTATCCSSPACASPSAQHLARGRHHDDRRARGIRRPGARRARRHARRTCACRRGCSSRPRPPQLAAEAAGTRSPDDPPLPPPGSCATPRRSPRSPSPTPATSSSTSRATRSTPRATAPRLGPRLPVRAWSTPTSTFTRVLGAHASPRSARRSSEFLELVDAAPGRAPGHAHLPLRELRAHAPALASPPGTASARPTSTSCSPTTCSSTSTRSCKRAVRVGSRSYSIKKLEPLYMGEPSCARPT